MMDLVGTEFQIKVWQELSKIPFGETRTYKDVAMDFIKILDLND